MKEKIIENKLLQALKEIESESGSYNQSPNAHEFENIWRIAFSAIQEYEAAEQIESLLPKGMDIKYESGIEELDELVKQFQNKEIDLCTFASKAWNRGYCAGIDNE